MKLRPIDQWMDLHYIKDTNQVNSTFNILSEEPPCPILLFTLR